MNKNERQQAFDWLNAVERYDGLAIDDHFDHKDPVVKRVKGVAIMNDGIVALENDSIYCLKMAYLDEKGIPHVSHLRLGGSVKHNEYHTYDGMYKIKEQYTLPGFDKVVCIDHSDDYTPSIIKDFLK